MKPEAALEARGKLGFPGLGILALVDALLLSLALLSSSPLSALATFLASALTLGRYGAMAGFSRGLVRRGWLLPLSLWLAFFGLLGLLLFLSGRKGLLLWPALVALSGPLVFLALSLGGALRGLPLVLAAQAAESLPASSGSPGGVASGPGGGL